jgi:hypothetical protein
MRIFETRTIAEKPPIENEVDILRKALNDFEYLRECRSAFEHQAVLESGFGKKVLQNPADPKILFDNGGAYASLGG